MGLAAVAAGGMLWAYHYMGVTKVRRQLESLRGPSASYATLRRRACYRGSRKARRAARRVREIDAVVEYVLRLGGRSRLWRYAHEGETLSPAPATRYLTLWGLSPSKAGTLGDLLASEARERSPLADGLLDVLLGFKRPRFETWRRVA